MSLAIPFPRGHVLDPQVVTKFGQFIKGRLAVGAVVVLNAIVLSEPLVVVTQLW